jgi:hypothetical protein
MAPLSTLTLENTTVPEQAASRVQFIIHQGKRVLSIDYSHCNVALMKAVTEEMHRVISRERLNSVLTLNDVTGTSFDQESVEVLKSRVAANAPYVKRAAVIGISGLQRLIYEAVKLFTKRSIRSFSNRQEALDYLVRDSGRAPADRP